MFRRSGPVSFKPVPYQRTSPKLRVPRSLVALVAGAAIGVAGVLYVQASLLPPTLSAAESTRLLAELGESNQQRQRLAAELEQARGQLQSARSDLAKAAGESAAAGEEVARLQQQIPQLLQALPPDPRGNPIGIRAAAFENGAAGLSYRVLVTDDRAAPKPFDGALQLLVAGRRASGGEETVTLDPVPLSFDTYRHLTGTATLPAGFTPQRATVRVLDAPGGGQLSLRIYNIR
jgi:hypothetical protein